MKKMNVLESRFQRVVRHMERNGYRVFPARYVGHGMELPTIDVDRLDMPELNSCWSAYEPADERQRVWALINSCRNAIERFNPAPEG